MNIPQQIGANYFAFGILLLNDHTGAVVGSLELKCLKDPFQIKVEILQKWINGEGKKPVTWRTLLECLKDIGMSTLAEDTQQALH